MGEIAVILSVEGLCAGYGQVQILHDISLNVRSGEIVTLLGANGAGKTSTLMSICGLLAPRCGRITFCGEEITDLTADKLVARGLVQVPEGRKIFPRLTVRENLELGAYLRRDSECVTRDFERVFELFPVLGERQRQAGGTLSGGEQQMLAIGRALMSRPKMLLMDEPSMGVAPILVQRIFATIATLNREGITILLVEQNARAALNLASRGYVIETGRIVLNDTADTLLNDERVIKAYLGGH